MTPEFDLLIVNWSEPAFVVIDILLAPAIVRVSDVPSASTFD